MHFLNAIELFSLHLADEAAARDAEWAEQEQSAMVFAMANGSVDPIFAC